MVDEVHELLRGVREGRQAVQEWGHTLLIGWTDRSVAFIKQICIANQSMNGGVIVVMLTEGQSKAAMEEDFYISIDRKELFNTKIVFRTGSPQDVHDLRQAAAHHARSLVILSIGSVGG